jgi:DNA repair protein SbcC/Rad50
MRLRQLEILTLPGIEPAFALRDIAPGVNLVTGPNAIGKSSLARALRYLAIIADDDPQAIALAAVFENGGLWTVRRTGSQVVWERDGTPVDPPPLPDRNAIGCYWLSMENLLAAEAGDERLVTQLRRALAGGFDLRVLRGGPFELRQRAGLAEAQRLSAAITTLHAAENHYHALRRDEAQLPRLGREITDARNAAGLSRRLEQAIALFDVLREREEIEAGLASFPDGMERLHGDEMARLEALDTRRNKLVADLETAQRRRQEVQADLVKTGLADARPDNSLLEAQEKKLALALRRRDQLSDRHRELAQARAEEEGARATFGGGESAPRFSPETITRAEQFTAELQAKRRVRDELAARIRAADQVPTDDEINRHLQAAEALRAWLAAPREPGGLASFPWMLAVIGGAAAILFGVLANAWVAAAGGVLALTGAVWAFARRGEGDSVAACRQFANSGLEPPAEWRRQAVLDRLTAVDQSLSGLRQERARAEAGVEDGRRLERAARELEALEERRAQLAQELGFDPGLLAAGIDHFVRYGAAWRQAADGCAALENMAADLAQEITALTADVGRCLAGWQIAADEDLESLRAALQRLRDRCRDAEVAEGRLAELDREIARLQRDLTVLDAEETGLYLRTGLERGARDALRARLEDIEVWRSQRERLGDARRREAQARQVLEGEEELLARAERGERDALLREQDAAREVADLLESLQERSTAIRTRLGDAGVDGRLEQAAAAIDAAGEALSDRREEALFAEAGQFLLDSIEAEYRSEHEPAVLRDAREQFRRFTHHAWDVALDEDEGWIARDLQQGARRGLAELSSGTRMQLLLAVRLAWIRSLEEAHEPFPLFLDEALTTSDESRFSSVAASVQRIATEEGRQVFYLSARRQEVALWARATGEQPHHIDLAQLRVGHDPVAAEDLVLPETAAIPAPAGRSPEVYAAMLGVQPVDPCRPEGALPIFHLLRDDLGLLRRLMAEWRISTLGQLEELLASSAAAAAIPEPERRKALAFRCAGARTWIANWKVGRGRLVDRIALERSAVVTGAFLDQATELAASLGGDAMSLLDALREGQVRRFRKDTVDQLEIWLTEQGYIDPAETLDAAGRERRTLLTLDGTGTPEDIRQLVSWLEAGIREAEKPVALSAV